MSASDSAPYRKMVLTYMFVILIAIAVNLSLTVMVLSGAIKTAVKREMDSNKAILDNMTKDLHRIAVEVMHNATTTADR